MPEMRDRDDVVRDALRTLEVAEHRPDFWSELRGRLDDEWTAAPAHGVREHRGRGADRWLAIAAAVVVLGAGVLVAARAGDRAPDAPAPPAGGTTTGPVRSLQGTVVIDVDGQPPARATFALDGGGRFAVRGGDGTSIVSDADAGVSVNTIEDGTTFVRTGTPLGPLGTPADSDGTAFLRRDVGWAIAALAAGGDDRVTTAEHAGRPVWRFDADIAPNPLGGSGAVDHLVAVVDRATSLPLLVRESAGDTVVAEQRVELLKVGASIDEGLFEVDGQRSGDLGWRRVGPDGAPSIAVPAGYRLAQVAVHDEPLVTGPEGGNPVTGPVTSYAYRRGIDVLVVTVQPAGPPGNVWDDPLATEGVAATRPIGGVATGGVAVDPRVVPHAWGVRGDRVVTVSGAASAAELLAALRSIRA